MIWFWIFVAIVLIILGLFIFTQGAQNLGPAISTIGVVILLILLVTPSRAHDHSRPELKPWFESLKSRAKASCCDGSDATRLDDIDWESSDGHYRVRLNGQWVDVPEDAVVDGPNRAGSGDGLAILSNGCPDRGPLLHARQHDLNPAQAVPSLERGTERTPVHSV